MSLPRLAIEYLALASLRLDAKNARRHNEKQVRQIAKSIEAFGFNVPLLVDASLQVVAGHGRLKACERLGIDQVPVIRLEHLSEQQRQAFMIADNRLTENSRWDSRLLGEQLKILSEAELDFSLEVTGFEMGEISVMIEGLGPASEADNLAHAVPEPSSVPVSCLGDMWQAGDHRLLCGDALARDNYASLMGDCRAAGVFADPPYSAEMREAEFISFLSDVFASLAAYSLPGSLHYICMNWRHMNELLAAGRLTYAQLANVCVWVKADTEMDSLYRGQHELVFVFKHGGTSCRPKVKRGHSSRWRGDVWHYPGAARTPVALVADAMRDCSARGDLVLDPFLADGATLVAAEQTGRICRGLERDPIRVDTAIRRWQAFADRVAYRVADGRTFNELETEARCE